MRLTSVVQKKNKVYKIVDFLRRHVGYIAGGECVNWIPKSFDYVPITNGGPVLEVIFKIEGVGRGIPSAPRGNPKAGEAATDWPIPSAGNAPACGWHLRCA